MAQRSAVSARRYVGGDNRREDPFDLRGNPRYRSRWRRCGSRAAFPEEQREPERAAAELEVGAGRETERLLLGQHAEVPAGTAADLVRATGARIGDVGAKVVQRATGQEEKLGGDIEEYKTKLDLTGAQADPIKGRKVAMVEENTKKFQTELDDQSRTTQEIMEGQGDFLRQNEIAI
jgi:hypothetical protein